MFTIYVDCVYRTQHTAGTHSPPVPPHPLLQRIVYCRTNIFFNLDSKVVPGEYDWFSFSDLQCISNLWSGYRPLSFFPFQCPNFLSMKTWKVKQGRNKFSAHPSYSEKAILRRNIICSGGHRVLKWTPWSLTLKNLNFNIPIFILFWPIICKFLIFYALGIVSS